MPLGHELPYRRSYLVLDLFLASVTALLAFTLGAPVRTLGACLLILYALIVSLTDFSHLIIPNRLTYTYALIGLVLALVDPRISLLQSLAGGLTGLALFWIIAIAGSKAFKRKALGGGDIKLATMIGLFVGPFPLLIAVFYGTTLALLYALFLRTLAKSALQYEIPFGPFLAVGSFLVYVGGNSMWPLDHPALHML